MAEESMVLTIDKKISVLSQTNNYYAKSGMGNNRQKMRNGRAVKLLSDITEKEAQIIFNNVDVQNAIFKIENTEILRTIFRKVPAFFQEIMFNNEKTQEILLTPKQSLKKEEFIRIYNYSTDGVSIPAEQLRQLENFLHTVKSPKIYNQIIENDFFQRVIAVCSVFQLNKSFFRGIDEVKLFYNIINNDEIYQTKKERKKNILSIFNKVSDHLLLSDDYRSVISPKEFIGNKKWYCADSKQVIVDKRALSLMTTEMIKELLEFNNVDIDFIQEFLETGIIESLQKNNYNFDKIFPHLLKREYAYFNGIDYLYYRVIIVECEKNEEVKKKFIDFNYKVLCNAEELNDNEKAILKDVLYNRIRTNNISKDDYEKLFHTPDMLKTIFYLKFGQTSHRMDYLNGISFKQMMLLNVKHINQILNMLEIDNEDELSNIYSYVIKLYLTFGLERSLKILNGDYGTLNRTFFDNLSSLNVTNVSFKKEGKKYLPNISKEFINFMFAHQNENHFIDMLNNPNCYLNKYWGYLYNNFDDLKDKCHNVMTLKKLNILFQQLSPTRDIKEVTPDNYKLSENDILNDICLGNKTRKSNGQIYKSVLEIYDKMKIRTESSIPYVKGVTQNGYSYEMMRLNDPIAFSLGYKADCCIRTEDIAHKHLLHATLCRNGRILLIYDQNNEIAGFAPLKRNGEVLIANSIECAHKKRNQKAIETFSEAIKDIVNTSQNNKNEVNPINLVCIGSQAYAKPDGKEFPSTIQTPTIYEKHEPIYRYTDQYHRNLTILYQTPNLDLNNIKYENPKCSYQDPRPQISSCDFRKSSSDEKDKALKVINAIRYANSDLEELANFRLSRKYGIAYCVYSDDWYILSDSIGNIYGDYLKYDDRAVKEYNIAVTEFQNQFNNGQKSSEVKLIKKLK